MRVMAPGRLISAHQQQIWRTDYMLVILLLLYHHSMHQTMRLTMDTYPLRVCRHLYSLSMRERPSVQRTTITPPATRPP